MDPNVITVVSGLPRSGTSMMMKMLEAGGIHPITDGERVADEDNPKGYYEYEPVKQMKKDTSWMPRAKGKSIKIIAKLLPDMPSGYEYRVLFMRRNMDEMLASQKKMLVRRGEPTDTVSDEMMAKFFSKHVAEIQAWIDTQPNIQVHDVQYNEVMKDPRSAAEKINAFLGGGLDVDAMSEVADPKLHRNRAD